LEYILRVFCENYSTSEPYFSEIYNDNCRPDLNTVPTTPLRTVPQPRYHDPVTTPSSSSTDSLRMSQLGNQLPSPAPHWHSKSPDFIDATVSGFTYAYGSLAGNFFVAPQRPTRRSRAHNIPGGIKNLLRDPKHRCRISVRSTILPFFSTP
jgi:hypothetical protein